MSRYRAFSIHLASSALVLSLVLGFIILRFYPGFYFYAEGGWDATRILIAVDLVLGPLLTLIIYQQGKKGLKLDLALIGLVQITALVYGSFILYTERPGFVVFTVDRFEVAEAGRIDMSALAIPELKIGSLTPPKTVFSDLPQGKERQLLFNRTIESGEDFYMMPEFYRPFPPFYPQTQLKRMHSDDFLRTSRDHYLLGQFFRKFGGTEEDYSFYPLVGNSKIMLAVVDSKTGELLTALEIDPWGD